MPKSNKKPPPASPTASPRRKKQNPSVASSTEVGGCLDEGCFESLPVRVQWPYEPAGSFREGRIEVGKELLPDVKLGKKIREGGRMGHEKASGTQDQKELRNKAYQEEVERLYRENPRRTYTKIKELTARKFSVKPRTIERRTKNPKRPPHSAQ